MSSVTVNGGQGNIMIVDDNPANLRLLEDMLRGQAYEVRSFPRGRLAIAAAEQEPPELILLDINMPEMNGYEVCEKLKRHPRLSQIPIIFLSAMDGVEDKVKGFRCGGVDYVSKPFQFEEVQARVEIQLRLRRAQNAEHELLEKTLAGAVGTLLELVQLASPSLAVRAHSIRDIMAWMVKAREISDPWQYELAAALSLLGCVALPDDVFERAYRGEDLSPEEERMFRGHPNSTAGLLSKIPRLERVADVIRWQQMPEDAGPFDDQSKRGARMLNLALEFDRRLFQGVAADAALAGLRRERRFDAQALDALKGYAPAAGEFERRSLRVKDLGAGMILDKDVLSKDGLLVLKKGTILSDRWIERLENFTRSKGPQDRIEVRVPRRCDMAVVGEGPR